MEKEKFIKTYIENTNINKKVKEEAEAYLERKAVTHAYSKLRSKINKKLVMAKKKYICNRLDTKLLLVLGYNVFNLLLEYSLGRKLSNEYYDESDIDNMQIWGLPILVSCNKDIIDVVCTARGIFEGFIPNKNEFGLSLVDMEKLINDLPEDGKRKVNEK